jgi:phosphatidylglycerol:prolipoprotein diacylglycerol transferase
MPIAVPAAIPYTTFPDIPLGPITLRTFGVMVGIGVLVGAWIGARVAESDWDLPRQETYRIATRMVIAAIIGARLTWVLTHPEEIDRPLDVIAVWQGGLQFAGGFIAAVAVGIPTIRTWHRHLRWGAADAYLYGLAAGLAIGRVGCYAVGEHFGGPTSFFLASRWEGGVPPDVREPTLGGIPIEQGTVFHNTSLYEFLHLVGLFLLLTWLRRRGASTGVLAGVFCLWYGVARLLTDFLRVNDELTLGLTGAQWMCLALIPTGLWILLRVRPALAAEGRPPASELWPGAASEEDEPEETEDTEEAEAKSEEDEPAD